MTDVKLNLDDAKILAEYWADKCDEFSEFVPSFNEDERMQNMLEFLEEKAIYWRSIVIEMSGGM